MKQLTWRLQKYLFANTISVDWKLAVQIEKCLHVVTLKALMLCYLNCVLIAWRVSTKALNILIQLIKFILILTTKTPQARCTIDTSMIHGQIFLWPQLLSHLWNWVFLHQIFLRSRFLPQIELSLNYEEVNVGQV